MNYQPLKMVLLSCAVSGLLFSCEPAEEPLLPLEEETSGANLEKFKTENFNRDFLMRRTYFGKPVRVGEGAGAGIALAVVQTDREGVPLSLGIWVTERAVVNLGHEMASYVLELPTQASEMPFDHITFDWNPHGHPPAQIYGLPHFDLHFYMISEEERMEIDFMDPLGNIHPEAQYLPAGYVPSPETIPMMGKHWIDVTAPEFKGEKFTQTFLYGSFDGEVIFYEPMFTRDYLLENENRLIPLKQPEAYQIPGLYYPTHYSIAYHPQRKMYAISLEGMVKR